jgi:2-polyprenyl-6-methoxyphenol hydroxylase-like FAD-dependent oxidoreductase
MIPEISQAGPAARSGAVPRSGAAVRTSVLVVGGGPAGLVLGCELARRGIDCVVAEKDGGPFGGSRGKGLQPRTQEVLEDLGVLDQVREAGGLYPPIQAHQGGQVVFEGRMDPLSEPTPDVPYPNVWMLPQSRTGDILRARLTELGGSVQFGAGLVSLSQDGGGVIAELSTGAGPLTIEADYLVGADGGHSTVRRALGTGFAGETREEQRMIVADVRAEGISRDYWHAFTGGAGPDAFRLALCPLAGTSLFQLTAPVSPELPVPGTDLAALQRIADEAAGSGLITLADLGWSSLYRTNIRMAESFRCGRVFLVGDAAHVHSPAGGQGLNTGMQDSHNLGWKLAAVLDGAAASLLDSYEDERMPVAASVLGISTELHDKAVERQSDAHRRDNPELRQLNLGYRAGPLTREQRADPGPVRAGDRAPDAPGHDASGNAVRLFDLIRGGRTALLAFGPAATVLAAELVASPAWARLNAIAVQSEPGGPGCADLTVFADTGHHARAGYGIADGQDVLLVVRPDGYLGLALDARPAEAATTRAYLTTLGALS